MHVEFISLRYVYENAREIVKIFNNKKIQCNNGDDDVQYMQIQNISIRKKAGKTVAFFVL